MAPAIVVGYLAAFLLSGARRFADKKLDAIFTRMYESVASRLRGEPAFGELSIHPHDKQAQEQVGQAIERTAGRDPRFAREPASLQWDLDRRRARNLVVSAPGSGTVIVINSATIIRNGHVYTRDDISDSQVWVKLATSLGALLTVAGLGWLVIRCSPGNPAWAHPTSEVFPQAWARWPPCSLPASCPSGSARGSLPVARHAP